MMKNVIISTVLLFFLDSSIIFSQDEISPIFGNKIELTNEEKQILIFQLSQKTEANQAAFNVWYYKTTEAIPNLIKFFEKQTPVGKFWFLKALAACNYKGSFQLFHNFIDSIGFYRLNHKLNYKEELAALLIDLGDYSRKDIIYDYVEKKSPLFLITAIETLKKIMENLVEEKERVKSLLIDLTTNSSDEQARSLALWYLYEEFKEKLIQLYKERFNAEQSYSNKLLILDEILKQIKTEETISFLKQSAQIEPDLSIRYRIFQVLLKDFGSPLNYKYVKDNKRLLEQWEYFNLLEYDLNYFKPSNQVIFEVNQELNNLVTYHTQCTSFNWLGNQSFSNGLKTYLTEAKTKLAIGDSIATAIKIKQYQRQIAEQYKDILKTDGKYVTEDGYKFLYYYPKYILERLPKAAN